MALTARVYIVAAWRRSVLVQAKFFQNPSTQLLRRQSSSACASSSTSTDASSSDKDAQLAAAWQRNSMLLSTGGTLGLSQQSPLHVFYTTQRPNSTSAAGVLSFPLTSGSSVQHLVHAAVPSPFGKGKETLHDPAVRAAVEIKAAQLAINKVLPPPEVSGALALQQCARIQYAPTDTSCHADKPCQLWRIIRMMCHAAPASVSLAPVGA
jgi:hypothetical protein